jgi:hypothetical protein
VPRELQEYVPGNLVASAGGVLGVEERVLDVGVPEPVLHEAELGAGIQQVRGDRMLETGIRE